MDTAWWPIRILLSCVIAITCGALAAAEQPAGPPADSTLVPVPDEIREKMPPPRSREEIRAVLGEEPAEADLRPLHIVLVAGLKTHGPGEHDYPAWQKAWQRLLSQAPRTRVTTAWEKPGDDDFKSADVLVFFKHKAWPREVNEQIDAFLARGGGIVLLHFAVDGGDNGDHVGKHLGLYWGPGARFRHGHLDLEFADRSDLPFLNGLAGRKLHFHDESYWRLTGDASRIDLLASAMEDDGDGRMIRVPLLWNRESGKGTPLRTGGRIHVNILGHYNWTFNDPLFRILVLRGIAWTAGEPVDRFASVVMADVSVKD